MCNFNKCSVIKMFDNNITFPPNSTRFAKFCKHLAIIIRERVAVFDGVSVTNPNCRGFKRAVEGKQKTKNDISVEQFTKTKDFFLS